MVMLASTPVSPMVGVLGSRIIACTSLGLTATYATSRTVSSVEAGTLSQPIYMDDMGCIGATPGSYGWLYRVSKAALNMAVVAAQGDYPQAHMVLMHPGWVQTDMGTTAATLTVQDSVARMRRTLAELRRPPGALSAQDVPYLQWDGTLFSSW